jgi:membrane protein implicated in regulation of membrane protease activity
MEDIDEDQKIFFAFERKIIDDKVLIQKMSNAQVFGLVLTALGAGMILFLPGLWWVLGALVSVGSALFIYQATKLRSQAEQNMREYQKQKAELVDHFMKRKDLWD